MSNHVFQFDVFKLLSIIETKNCMEHIFISKREKLYINK